ncbi:MAG: tetratricopeptide repeat protein [Thermaerobacter sp.]|nr:tetratricopeptide repeat protein [Thermaerobacter sp.]
MKSPRLVSSLSLFVGLASVLFTVAGCGSKVTSPPTRNTGAKGQAHSSKAPSTIVEGAAQYTGNKNLKRWETLANQTPSNWTNQIQAGRAAYTNGKTSLAVHYYLQAIKADPRKGLAYNNLGNVYAHLMNNYAKAAQYYQKTTQVDPRYDYGWLNWSMAETQLGHASQGKSIAQQALSHLPQSDPLYKYLQRLAQGKKV